MREDAARHEETGPIRAFVGVGSNIRPEENVLEAVAILAQRARLKGVSTFYQTAALGAEGAQDFYNGVVEILFDGDAAAVQRLLAQVEDVLGRVRTEDAYAPRVIDLDLLTWRRGAGADRSGDVHPDVTRRGFVAVPLLELAPELVLGEGGRPLAEVVEGFRRPPGRPLAELSRRLRALVR